MSTILFCLVSRLEVLFVESGPHFYINMDDLPNFRDSASKDTCFGKIVEGQAILDYMASHHAKNFLGMSMFGIEDIEVLKPIEVSDKHQIPAHT